MIRIPFAILANKLVYYYIFLFIFGLAFGSFINVVSLRYRPSQKIFDLDVIGGRSRCPVCKKQLKWHELIPLFSFLVQKGKCRHCDHAISLQYPIVEFLTAIIFVAVPAKIFNLTLTGSFQGQQQFSISNFYSIFNSHWLTVIIWLAIFLLFVLLAIIDFYHYIIPNEINILLAILGVFLIPLTVYNLQFKTSFMGHYALLFNFSGSSGILWANHIISSIISMIFFGLIIVLSRGKGMGWGDFKLAGALGLIFGWPDILLVLSLSFIVGAIFSLALISMKRKKIKDAVPFGPFLVIGAALVFFYGFQIVDLYFRFFGLYF